MVDKTTLASICQQLENICTTFPVPLSTLSGEILFELSGAHPDWMRIFSLEIDFFEIHVSFFSFIVLSELEKHPDVAVHSSISFIEDLAQGTKLSSGHWWAMLREASRDLLQTGHGSMNDVTAIAIQLFFDTRTTQPSRFSKILNDIPNIRNKAKGHSYTLTTEQYTDYAHQLLQYISSMFDTIKDMSDVVIFYIAQCTATASNKFSVEICILQGDSRRPLRKHIYCNESVNINEVWIGKRSDTQENFDITKFLLLSPFIEYNLEKQELYIAHGYKNGKLEMLGVIGANRSISSRSEFGTQRLERIIQKSGAKNQQYQTLLHRAKELAKILLTSPVAIASYNNENYLTRPRLSQQLESIENRDNIDGIVRVWLTYAPSGFGKTALACHAISRWQQQGTLDQIMVVILSTELTAHNNNINIWWQQKFGQSIQESCAIAFQANAVIRVFIDGLDRLSTPFDIIDQICFILESSDIAEVIYFIALSTESIALSCLDRFKQKGFHKKVHRWSIPPFTPTESRHLYGLLQTTDAKSTLGTEVESLLISPLLVKLAVVLGEEETSAGITPGRLLRAHADKTVLADSVKAHLALKIVDQILEEKKKNIPLTRLLQDSSLRSLLLTSQEGPLQQLVQEHVLLLDRSPNPHGLPLPSETMLSFAFDAQLDYLVFVSIAQKYGIQPKSWKEAFQHSAVFGPLIGGMRIFIVEHLLHNTDAKIIEELADLLHHLGDVGTEVWTDLLTTGLDSKPESSLYKLIQRFVEIDANPQKIKQIAASSTQRLVTAGRAKTAIEVMEMLKNVAMTEFLVGLYSHTIHIAAWTYSIPIAIEMARSLVQKSLSMSIDMQFQAKYAFMEVLNLSGTKEDNHAKQQIEEELLEMGSVYNYTKTSSQVLYTLLLVQHTSANDPKAIEYLDKAEQLAFGNTKLEIRVALAKALWYTYSVSSNTEEHLSTAQKTCQELVDIACSIGDPFTEALGCDLCAEAWRNNPAIQLDWIEHGILVATALHATIAHARLLDRRGRLYLRMGKLQEAIKDTAVSSEIYKNVGHKRHALRSAQHALALEMQENNNPGKPYHTWEQLIAEADQLGVEFQRRLLRLLQIDSLCALGHTTEASQCLHQLRSICETPIPKDVHLGIVEGKIYCLHTQYPQALDIWKSAYNWAMKEQSFDVAQQCFLISGWTIAVYTNLLTDTVTTMRLQLIDQLRERLENHSQASFVERYIGETRLLLTFVLLLENKMDEAQARLESTRMWFVDHPRHPLHIELNAVEILYLDKQYHVIDATPETTSNTEKQDTVQPKTPQQKRIEKTIQSHIYKTIGHLTHSTNQFRERSLVVDFLQHHRVHQIFNYISANHAEKFRLALASIDIEKTTS